METISVKFDGKWEYKQNGARKYGKYFLTDGAHAMGCNTRRCEVVRGQNN